MIAEKSDYITTYLEGKDWLIKENANTYDSYTKLRGFIADNTIREWVLDNIYPKEVADAHRNGDIYIHDLSDGIIPYSYYGKTVILVRDINKKEPFFISLEDVQGMKNLEVLMGGDKWTRITNTIRHTSHTDMLRIETDNGRILMVTEDHPMFVGYSLNTVPASTLKVGDVLCSALPFNRFNFGKKTLPPKLAWLVGLYIAEGSKRGKDFVICQRDESVKQKVLDLLDIVGIKYSIYDKDIIIDGNDAVVQYLFSNIKSYAENKAIPSEPYSTETLFNIISGIFDGDGGLHNRKEKYATEMGIDSTSFELVNQIKMAFDALRIRSTLRSYENKNYKRIYKIRFYLNEEQIKLFEESVKLTQTEILFRKKENSNVDPFDKMPKIKSIEKIPWVGKPVYDISTESEIFSTCGLKVHNCRGHDIRKILRKGLLTHTVTGGRPKHFSSLFNQLVNMIGTAQQNWAGAQAISHINTLSAPFIRKDYGKYRNPDGTYPDWVFREVKQVIQEFVFDLNFPSRAGSQTPFTNIILDFMCPENMRDEEVHNYGCEGTYGDYEIEARLILEAFNEVFYEGDAKGAPFTFPVVTINCIPETPYDSELWKKLIKTTIKMGTYSFFNYDGTGINPNTVESMCCRLALDLTQIAEAGGRWAYGGETGSIGIVTINMPRIGYLAKDEDDLYRLLEERLNLAKIALLTKGLFIEKTKERLLSFDRFYDLDLTHFFRTIGIVGLNEMCINFNGKTIVDNVDLVKRVMNYLRNWLLKTQKETGLLWNAEQTPAESCSPKLAKKDKKLFGDDIFAQGSDGVWYYTSLLTDPAEDIPFAKRTMIEEEILPMFSGGTVYRVYLYDKRPNVEATAKFIKKMMKNTKIPYFDLAITLTNCPTCKKSFPGAHDKCPQCGGEVDVYDRIVGYYRPRSRVNEGRLLEIQRRKRYNIF